MKRNGNILSKSWSYLLNAQVCFLFSLFLPFLIGAQNRIPVDSLAKMIKDAGSLFNNKPDSAIYLMRTVVRETSIRKMHALKGQAYLKMGLAQMTKGKWSEAGQSYRNSIRAFQLVGDSLALADGYNQLGYVFQATRQYEKSMEYQFKALAIRQRHALDPREVAKSEGAIGISYQYIGEYDKAIQHHLRALELRKQSKLPVHNGIGFVHKNIGVIHFLRKEFPQAIKEYQIAMDTFVKYNNLQFVGVMHRLFGELYIETEEYEKAKVDLNKAVEIAEQLGAEGIKARSFAHLGEVALKEKQYSKAIRLLETSIGIARQTGDRQLLIQRAFDNLIETYVRLGDYEAAYRNQHEFAAIKDSLTSVQSSVLQAQMRAEYETDRIQRELLQAREKEQQSIRSRNYLLAGLAIAVLFLFALFQANRRRKMAYSALLAEKNKTEKLLVEKDFLLDHLQKTQKQLIAWEKMASIGQLTAGIAHEVNNPINFVSGNIQALQLDFQDLKPLLVSIIALSEKEGIKSETEQQLIETAEDIDLAFLLDELEQLITGIHRGSQRIQNIVRGLKTFSRQSDEVFTETNLGKEMDAALTILQNKLKSKNIEVTKTYKDLPDIKCQSGKISQVFLNLIDNAIYAMPEGGKLRLGAKKLKGAIEISIQDSGVGMDEETINRIFEPFYTTKEVGEGTGLGLAISYGIIQEHRGSIEVQSTKGEGTTFKIALPFDPEAADLPSFEAKKVHV